MLKENFKDEIPQGGKRKYGIRDNLGNYIYRDVEIVRTNGNIQDGDRYGAAEVNEERSAINQLTNPNLLINGDFKIWQQGTSFVNVANTYTADRWVMLNGISVNCSSTSTGMRIVTSNSYIRFGQYIEGKLDKVTYSVSAKINNVLYTLSLTPSDSVKFISSEEGSVVQFSLSYVNNNTLLQINVNSSDITVQYAKLELGEIVTVYVPKPYSEEIIAAQRYYEYNEFAIPYNGANYFISGFTYQVSKRSVPTITIVEVTDENNVLSGSFQAFSTNYRCVPWIRYNSGSASVLGARTLLVKAHINSEIY